MKKHLEYQKHHADAHSGDELWWCCNAARVEFHVLTMGTQTLKRENNCEFSHNHC